MRCPACERRDEVEQLEDGRYYCVRDRLIFTPDTEPTLIDAPERVRRDLE